MKQCFAYIRVSTTKQKEKGVSLKEQKDAIVRYANVHGLEITEWFEDIQTAAKCGRAQFNLMLRLLRSNKAAGVIIHKIDRSARNLKDWSDLGELIDAGIAVHFANESLDLHTRGGRLSADIQAIVAADFIRNLREETKKGFYGRLKQGIYPLGAPLGYSDRGKGKPKAIDPVKGPMVRLAFELYASGRYSLVELVEEMYRQGLRNRRGGRVTKNGLSTVLNNPFFCGTIWIRKTNERFQGIHTPLITASLFESVQYLLRGKTHTKAFRHDLIFRRLLTCAHCGKRLRGERQKGHTYYRCHTKGCLTKCVREERVEESVKEILGRIVLSEDEKVYFSQRLQERLGTFARDRESQQQAWRLQLGQVRSRLERLVDAYLEGALDKAMLERRKAALLTEERKLQEKLSVKGSDEERILYAAREMVELATMAWLSYEMQTVEQKRELVRLITSNRIVRGKNVSVEPFYPFALLARRADSSSCDLKQTVGRSVENMPKEAHIETNSMCRLGHVIEEIYDWFISNPQACASMTHILRSQE